MTIERGRYSIGTGTSQDFAVAMKTQHTGIQVTQETAFSVAISTKEKGSSTFVLQTTLAAAGSTIIDLVGVAEIRLASTGGTATGSFALLQNRASLPDAMHNWST